MASYTEADLTSIRAAISSGTRKVTFADGRSQEYQSLDHLLAAERVIAASIEVATASARNIVRRKLASFSNGC